MLDAGCTGSLVLSRFPEVVYGVVTSETTLETVDELLTSFVTFGAVDDDMTTEVNFAAVVDVITTEVDLAAVDDDMTTEVNFAAVVDVITTEVDLAAVDDVIATEVTFAAVMTSELIFIQNLYLLFAMMALQGNIHTTLFNRSTRIPLSLSPPLFLSVCLILAYKWRRIPLCRIMSLICELGVIGLEDTRIYRRKFNRIAYLLKGHVKHVLRWCSAVYK